MLTFSEALSLIKSARDMRCKEWPLGVYVRAVANPNGVMVIKRFNINGTSEYFNPTQSEMLGQTWEAA